MLCIIYNITDIRRSPIGIPNASELAVSPSRSHISNNDNNYICLTTIFPGQLG